MRGQMHTGFREFILQCLRLLSIRTLVCTDLVLVKIPVHYYGNFEGLASHLGQVNATYPNMTMWVTEYNLPQQSLAATQEFYNQSSSYFDRIPYVYVPHPRATEEILTCTPRQIYYALLDIWCISIRRFKRWTQCRNAYTKRPIDRYRSVVFRSEGNRKHSERRRQFLRPLCWMVVTGDRSRGTYTLVMNFLFRFLRIDFYHGRTFSALYN